MSEQTTLRDQLAAAFDAADAPAETPAAEAPAVESAPIATDGPARDDKGRFAPKSAGSDAPTTQTLNGTAASPSPADTAPPVEEKPKPPRPSSWKKEMWGHWDTLNPDVQAYLNQRESEYSRGVSTYKQEYDRLKPLADAVEPFMPLLQQHNIPPAQWLQNLGNAHKTLALGSPQEKAAMFAQLARDYNVPLDQLGNVQPMPIQQAAQSPTHTLWNELTGVKQQLQQFLTQAEQEKQAQMAAEISAFAAKHEHFEQVRETMSRLLGAGVAQDLEGAYAKAIRMHDDIWQAEQEKFRQAEEAKKAEAARAAAAKARAAAVSPRSAAPTGPVTGATDGKKDRRSVIAEQLESMGGRV